MQLLVTATTPTPTGQSGGLVQLRILQQWAAAGGRRPTAVSAAGRRRPQNIRVDRSMPPPTAAELFDRSGRGAAARRRALRDPP